METETESVPALRRAVRVLDYVSSAAKPPNAAEVTRALKLPKSSAHGLIGAMLDLHLLVRADDGCLRPGPYLMRWANGFLAQLDIVSIFQSYFAENPGLARYTVTLTVRDGAEVVYLSCRNSDQPLGVTFRIGMRLPATFTATGKALLAELEDETLENLLTPSFPAPLTSHSVRNIDMLRQELMQMRARGFSIDDGQVREGMICLGAVLRGHDGLAVAGIALSLTRSEATPDMVAALGEELREAATRLSRRFGAV
ncbi:IclR family transcriptional regulator [Acidocella sp.]|uniref:IclR family transcriptional regulator n=1 Tax=Acidocella sp. TaxID=50710 RepID=UPI003CFC67A9